MNHSFRTPRTRPLPSPTNLPHSPKPFPMAGMGHPLYIQTALSGLTDLASATITVAFAGGAGAACEDTTTVSTAISIDLDYGNYPLKVI